MVCAQHQAVIKAMCQDEPLPRPADINDIPCPEHLVNRLQWRSFLVCQFMMWVYGLVEINSNIRRLLFNAKFLLYRQFRQVKRFYITAC